MRTITIRLMTLIAVLAVVVAACGDTEGMESAPQTPASGAVQPALTTEPEEMVPPAGGAPRATGPPTTTAPITIEAPPPVAPATTATEPPPETTTTVPETTTTVAPTTTTPVVTAPVGSFSVTDVAESDTLNVRAGAGVEHDIVARLERNATGVRTTGRGLASADGGVWWEIELFQGPSTGWVNSAFLQRNAEPCNNEHGVLGDLGVFVTTPQSGDTVGSGFTVAGCSRSLENIFFWQLYDHTGTLIAGGEEGYGGGLGGPASYSFTVDYHLEEPGRGWLVVEDDQPITFDGPAMRNEIPLILDTGANGTSPFTGPCSGGLASPANSVILTEPTSGTMVAPGFTISGCANVFEAEVWWFLLDASGAEIARGSGFAGHGEWRPFSATLFYEVDHPQMGRLVVVEDDPTDGEGFPSFDNVVPLVLSP